MALAHQHLPRSSRLQRPTAQRNEPGSTALDWLARFEQDPGAPAVFLPLLEIGSLTRAHWQRVTGHALAWVQARPPSATHVAVFQALARHARRLDDDGRAAAVLAWFRCIELRGGPWFTRTSRQAITALTEGTRHADEVAAAIEHATPELPCEPSSHPPRTAGELAAWIRRRARADEATQVADVRVALDHIRTLAAEGTIFRATAVLPALLPLGSRGDDPSLRVELAATVLALISDPRLTAGMRRLFLHECRARLEEVKGEPGGVALAESLAGILVERA